MPTLTVLVLHPHPDPVTREWRNPGDLVEWTQEELELRERNLPFPYYHVQEGTRVQADEATRVAPTEQLPDHSPVAGALRIGRAEDEMERVAAVIENLDKLNHLPDDTDAAATLYGDPDEDPALGQEPGPLVSPAAMAMEPTAEDIPPTVVTTVIDDEPGALGSLAEMAEPSGSEFLGESSALEDPDEAVEEAPVSVEPVKASKPKQRKTATAK